MPRSGPPARSRNSNSTPASTRHSRGGGHVLGPGLLPLDAAASRSCAWPPRPFEVLLDGLGAVADVTHSVLERFLGHAELLAPITQFVRLVNIDARAVLAATLLQVVRHGISGGCRSQRAASHIPNGHSATGLCPPGGVKPECCPGQHGAPRGRAPRDL